MIEVPDLISDEQAVFTEPLAAAFGITEQVKIENATNIAVIGDGKLGLLCAMTLRLRSNNVTLFGRHASKLAIAEKRGIEGVVDVGASDMNRRFDVVVEASGSETGFARALDLVKTRGKIVLKSTFHGKPQWEAWRVVVDEITIVGSRCGRFKPAIDLLAEGKLDVTDMISEEFRLDDGVKAMAAAAEKGILKVLLSMG